MENKSDIQTDRETLDAKNFMGGEGVESKGVEGVGSETSTDANETSGWTSIFPKEDRERYAEQLKGFAKPKDLLAEWSRLAEREKRAVVVPDENATDEDLKAFRKAMKIPESADGYSLPDADEDFKSWYKSTAFEAGMTKTQAEKFFKAYLAEDARRAEETARSKERVAEENTLTLKREWGDKADANYTLAKRAFKEYGDSDFRKLIKENNLESDPRLIKTFYSIAVSTMGDRGTEGDLYHEKEREGGLHYDI